MLNNVKHKLMGKSRKKKFNDFLRLTMPTSQSLILDVGVADKEFSPYDNFLEKAYPEKSQITVLSIQDLKEFPLRYPEIKSVIYQGGEFPFLDKQFSVVHSNAVVEHVGNRQKQFEFICEIARCGEQFYFTTPAKEFPVEVHTNYPFVHWLPKSMFNKVVAKLGKGWASGDYMNLLTRKELVSMMENLKVKEFKVITYKIGLLPFQYIVWGRS